MDIKEINLGRGIKTLGRVADVYGQINIRAYDSEHQNKTLKITKTNKEKYFAISAYFHDDFVAVYVRKSPKKGKQSK